MAMEEDVYQALMALRDELQGAIDGLKAEIREIKESLRKVADEPDFLDGCPESLKRELEPTLQAMSGADDKTRAHLVLEVLDLCEEARKHSDPNLPFFRDLPVRLQGLVEAAGLEPVVPQPGDAYRSSEHMVLRTVRGDGARDTVERCLRKGYRFRGQLLRKAEVSLHL